MAKKKQEEKTKLRPDVNETACRPARRPPSPPDGDPRPRTSTPACMIRGEGEGYVAPPSSRSCEATSGWMDEVEHVRSRRVKIALDGFRVFPPKWAALPLFSYDGSGCHRLARSADRAVAVELGRFLAVIYIACAVPARQSTRRRPGRSGSVRDRRSVLPSMRCSSGSASRSVVPEERSGHCVAR